MIFIQNICSIVYLFNFTHTASFSVPSILPSVTAEIRPINILLLPILQSFSLIRTYSNTNIPFILDHSFPYCVFLTFPLIFFRNNFFRPTHSLFLQGVPINMGINEELPIMILSTFLLYSLFSSSI